ncbi:MAG TPA: SAM-dependent methyltransferase [Candidatus Saccharimonadales bacterium]|nr:SAM-dependent methyltransferase [Candidatus Saccharimonadales bacterium]
MSADIEVRNPASEGITELPRQAINFELNTTTAEEITRAIDEAGGAISFSRYMDTALYGPDGYYSAGKADIRASGQGHFKTWPVASTDFCEAVGVATDKIWTAMDGPKLDLVESGAGNGVMMKDVLVWMRTERPDLYASTSAHIIEQGDMALQQRLTIGGRNDPTTTLRRGSRAETSTPDEHRQDLSKVRWHRGSAIQSEIGEGDATIFISNELPDAFPVEVVRREGGTLQQMYVTMDGGELAAEWHPLQPEVEQYMEQFAVDVTEGGEIAVNLNAVAWQENLNGLLHRGGIITIDYGLDGAREFRPNNPPTPQSSLTALLGQLGASDQPESAVRTYPAGLSPLQAPGEVDLTSDVDFNVLAQVAQQGGLDVAFSGSQTDFLVACGVPTRDELDSIRGPRTDAEQIRISAAKDLQLPRRSTFRALVLTRGVDVDFSVREPLLSAYDRLIPDTTQ